MVVADSTNKNDEMHTSLEYETIPFDELFPVYQPQVR